MCTDGGDRFSYERMAMRREWAFWMERTRVFGDVYRPYRARAEARDMLKRLARRELALTRLEKRRRDEAWEAAAGLAWVVAVIVLSWWRERGGVA